MPVIVQFRNGKFGVRATGGGFFKSPYLFLRNHSGGDWCDPSTTPPSQYEFRDRGAAESALFQFTEFASPDFGTPVESLYAASTGQSQAHPSLAERFTSQDVDRQNGGGDLRGLSNA